MSSQAAQSQPQKSGFAPGGQSSLEFVWGEQQTINVPGKQQILLNISAPLKKRKLYLYLWGSAASGADNYIKAWVRFSLSGSQVGALPCFIGNSVGSNSKVDASLPSLMISGGNPIADSLGIVLSNNVGSQPNTVLLQPNIISVEADLASLDIDSQFGNNTMRAFIAIRSNY